MVMVVLAVTVVAMVVMLVMVMVVVTVAWVVARLTVCGYGPGDCYSMACGRGGNADDRETFQAEKPLFSF